MQTFFDRIAITLSSICVIHCIAFPIIASLIPIFSTTIRHGHAMHEFWFHHFILLFIFPFSLIAIVAGYQRHKQFLPVVIIFAGILISNNIIPHQSETVLTLIGGIIHAAGHFMNLTATTSHRITCVNH